MNPAIDTVLPAVQLDVLGFPLEGSHLIEASAGTGKTFTIALLYVRLVLGHGRSGPHAQGLTPPEILVMTFTEAATQELRDRIRKRLTEAADYFRQPADQVPPSPKGKDLLYDLRAEYPPEQWTLCARKLQLAAEWMDEAAVSTIHAWCYRMLREHAFDSDSLFTQQLETDQSELYAEVVRDYWRTFLAPLDETQAREVAQWWAGPETLEKALKHLTPYPEQFQACAVPSEQLHDCHSRKNRLLQALKAKWTTWAGELKALLQQAYDDNHVNRRSIQPRFYQPWLDSLLAWATTEDLVRPVPDLNTGWTRLTPEGMAQVWTVGEPPQHPAFDAIAALPLALDSLPNARFDILRHAAWWVGERFQQEQSRRAQMGFNDLLNRLRDALKGPNAERLASLIRHQFPAALIDEFQDTDPVQYEIFDRVYSVENPYQHTTLVLIGDPKQAIYAFRGADIFTYLKARFATTGRHHTLKVNYRSTQAMINASNAWFRLAEDHHAGPGAFLFRKQGGENPLPFNPAEAEGRQEAWSIEDKSAPAMTVWWLEAREEGKPLSKEAYYSDMAAACASEIRHLLTLGQSRQAGFKGPAGFRSVQPADIAILVNSRKEAAHIRQALRQRGVRSVYLSDRDSVYQSETAGDVLLWLSACSEPTDLRRLRTAMATATLGQQWSELDRFNHDELFVEGWVQRFRGYQDCWLRRGVLAMIRLLIADFNLPARLLGPHAEPNPLNGERILTDVLHLAELLQQTSQELEGEQALIRFLAEQIQASSSPDNQDAPQIRLESDADRVKVITVHKSKGLEYPLVFIPYAANFRQTKPTDLPLKWHESAGQLVLALESTPEDVEKADQERLGEDIRKLYVALTRARYATWIGAAPLTDLHKSALGYLITQGKPIEPTALALALSPLANDCDSIRVEPAPEATDAVFVPETAAQLGSARQYDSAPQERWFIASYSGIKTARGAASSTAETATEDTFQEALSEDESDANEQATSTDGANKSIAFPHNFPKGADAGTFLHGLFEWAAQQGFATTQQNQDSLRKEIDQRCQLRGWQHFIEPLTQWVMDWLTTPLMLSALNGMLQTQLTLAGLSRAVPEMEFWLAANAVETTMLDKLVTRHTLSAEPRPTLAPDHINGLLKGFMDLVFEHEGRYYVLDYKSNVLGPDDAAYTPKAMRTKILHERYELQYVLYLLALHRHLRSRLPDYRYEDHIGGAVYVFLRGLKAPSQGLHVECPPAQLIEALDLLLSPDLARAA
jgi:exodeoxyribonuclease V beta subunit